MILIHVALTSLNMRPVRAIWHINPFQTKLYDFPGPVPGPGPTLGPGPGTGPGPGPGSVPEPGPGQGLVLDLKPISNTP